MSAPLALGGPASLQYANNAVASQPDSTFVYALNGGCIAETLPATLATTATALTSGTLNLAAIHLGTGTTVAQTGFVTGSTAAVAPTHWWACLVDQNLVVKAVTADQTSTALGASTWFPLSFAAAFTTLYSGLYYLGLMIAVTTTQPTIVGAASPNGALVTGTGAPALKLGGSSSTGLTTPPAVGSSVIAPSAAAATPYLYCA